jgi:hypothetical protein
MDCNALGRHARAARGYTYTSPLDPSPCVVGRSRRQKQRKRKERSERREEKPRSEKLNRAAVFFPRSSFEGHKSITVLKLARALFAHPGSLLFRPPLWALGIGDFRLQTSAVKLVTLDRVRSLLPSSRGGDSYCLYKRKEVVISFTK